MLWILCVNFHSIPYSVWHVLQVSYDSNWKSHHQGHPNSSNFDNTTCGDGNVYSISWSLWWLGSLSAWLTNTTVITAVNVLMIVAVGIYVHFPTNLFEQCRRCSYLSAEQNKQRNELHPPEHNNSTETRFNNPHSTITTETTPLITDAPKTGHHNDPSHTTVSIADSPVTTVTAPLVSKSAPSQRFQCLKCGVSLPKWAVINTGLTLE